MMMMVDWWMFDASSILRLTILYMSLFSIAAQSSIQPSTNISWPASTTADGSSTHGENLVDNVQRQYSASYAIDGKTNTF